MTGHGKFALGILVLGSVPVLAVAATFVASVLTYDSERERCFNDGGFTCGVWYEECQRKRGCNFATYWPPLALEQDLRIDQMNREHKAWVESVLGWSSPP